MVISLLVIMTVLAIAITLVIVMTFFIILTAIRNRSWLRRIRTATDSRACTAADGGTDNGTALPAHALSHRSPCGSAQCTAEYRAAVKRKGSAACRK